MAIIRSHSTRASLPVSSDIASLCRLIAARRMPAISLAALGLAFAPHAQATVINVFAGDVTENDTANCSIVDAIVAADGNTVVGACPAGDDSTNGGDTIVLPAGSTFAAAATLNLRRAITIEGNGATLDGSNDHTVLSVNGAGIASIMDVTITNGNGNSGGSGNYGGGIYNAGTLTLTGSTVSGNSATGNGGGIYNTGTLTLTGSTVSGNSAYGGGGIDGGGSGTLTLIDSTVSGNSAGHGASSFGGGIQSRGTVTLTGSTVSGNTASGTGGGIFSSSLYSVTLTNSTVSGNHADINGGGVYDFGGGTFHFYDSTISGNTTDTIKGGGIYLFATDTIFSRCLITGNTASAGGYNEVFSGSIEGFSTVALDHNLFGHSGETRAQAFLNFTPDASDIIATSDGTLPKALGSILNTTLANNGGPTQTLALVSGSPAIGAGATGCPATDQRGNTRPPGSCDIGAFQSGPPADLSLSQSANTNPVHISTTAGLTYTLTVRNNSSGTAVTGLVLTETLASGLTYNTFSSADAWTCSAASQVVSCTLFSLAPGASSSVDLTINTGATAGSIKTTGSVSALNTDPAPANNNKNVTTLLCDPAGTDSIGFGATSFAATEGAGPVTITVNRSGASCSNATVHYATVAGGSAPASNFTAASGDFTWLPLDANKKTFVVPITNDSVYTGNRTVNLALSSPSSNATLTKSTSVINIKDDEVPLTIGLSTTDQTVSEEGGVATVTATLTGVRTKDTIVPLTITGAANKTKDYTLSGTSITILAGNLSGSVTLTGLHDALDESNETAVLTMGVVSGVAASGTTTNTITFSDDDATPTVSFDTAASTKSESKANVVTLLLSAASGQDVTVNVSSTGGSATVGADYTINGAGTVTISAGATSATAVTIINDTTHESSETAVFHIDSASNATPAGIQSTTLTITDNDP